MLKKSQVMGERSWTAEVAILRICGGISDVGSSVLGISRIRSIRNKLVHSKKGSNPFIKKDDKDRLDKFIAMMDELFPGKINQLDLHPVAWYLLLKRKGTDAIHPKFEKSIAKIFNNEADPLVVQVKKGAKNQRWSKLATITKMAELKNPQRGKPLNWFFTKTLDNKMEPYIWRVCSANDASKKKVKVTRPATKVENELVLAVKELRKLGLQKQIKALKPPNNEGPFFETNVFYRKDFYLLLKETTAGKKLIKRVSDSTLKPALSNVVLSKGGRPHDKHESFVKAELMKLRQQ